MFHPVGSEPPSVYWRRRLLLIAAVVAVLVLAVLTVKILSGGSGGKVGAAGTSSRSTPARTSPTTRSGTAAGTAAGSSTTSPAASTSAVPTKCALSALQVAALVGKKTYPVGASPVVELQVINTGPQPCVQNLADSQIELRVFNGSSRVWGSHDCAIQPGTKNRTLAVGRPYVSAVLWGGLSSRPGCAGQRQRIGAGTYTLYALLSGKQGTSTTFSIS